MDVAVSNHSEAALIERRRNLLGPAYRLLYSEPVHFVRGEGVYLYDAQGEAYLDVYNNVPSVGHCHPRVVEALCRQAATLNTHTRYLHETVLDYAEALLATFPSELGHVMFTCTGSEANDLALRVARACTGGTGVIVTSNAYHGVTLALAEMSPSLGSASPIGPHVRTVAAPDSYRGRKAATQFEQDVRDALDDMRQAGVRPAAILLDTAFASDGFFPDPAEAIAGGIKAMREAGGLYIADEVQAGLGRPGTHWWAFERRGPVPDLVTLGKPMGGGHPLAALVARPELLEGFGTRTRYFNTFGGNPVSAAVGLEVLKVIDDEKLMANALAVGGYIRKGVEALAARHESICDVRALGLYLGVEIVHDRETREACAKTTTYIVDELRRNRVLVGICGSEGNVLKIRPPLPFTQADADLFLDRLDHALGTAGP